MAPLYKEGLAYVSPYGAKLSVSIPHARCDAPVMTRHLLHVSASRCQPQRVITTKLNKATCQSVLLFYMGMIKILMC
jgi:hypothetical protein